MIRSLTKTNMVFLLCLCLFGMSVSSARSAIVTTGDASVSLDVITDYTIVGDLLLGSTNSGTLGVSSGLTLTVQNRLAVGQNEGGQGEANISGVLNVNGAIQLGGSGSGVLAIHSGGQLNAAAGETTAVYSTGTLQLNGGMLNIGEGGLLLMLSPLQFTENGGTVNLGVANLSHTQQALDLSDGAIRGEGQIFVGSAGLLLGTAGHEGNLSGTAGDQRLVVYGAVSGSGSMTNVTVYGDVSVGDSPGTIIADDLNLAGNGTLRMELGGTAAGTDYDQIIANGPLALDGTLDIQWYDGFEAGEGDSFTLFAADGGAVSGTFDTINLPEFTEDSLSWDTSGLYTTGQIAVVPEPALLGLIGLGVTVMFRRKR